MADALVNSLLRSLNSIIQPELGLVFSARQELQNLSSAFTAIQAVLHDAEQRQTIEEAVSDWLGKLKDVAYDVDDLLDEWKAEALRLEIEGTGIPTCGKKVINFLLHRLCFNEQVDEVVFQLKLGIEMGRRVKMIRERLDMICNEKTKFHLGERPSVGSEIEERRTSSLIDESVIVGREPDKERVVNWVVMETSFPERIPIISIVGMAGIGKTTLAQLVYKDERVIMHFDKRIWVHVSDVFDEMRICKAIIEAIDEVTPPNYLEWEMVHSHLSRLIERKRFLLVLDDVWNESHDKWDKLRLPLHCAASGSRILVTTRNEIVSKVMGMSFTHHLYPLLKEEDCWLLFHQIAFSGRRRHECFELEEVGQKIAAKCEGVPLVLKRIGKAMQLKRTLREWKLVLESETWDLPRITRDITRELQVSYYNLPLHLKQCFAFCSLFPRDHVIEKEMLIKLWMSHGFILYEGSGELESVGEGNFADLLGRSLFDDPMIDDQGNVLHCKMKDIVHDLFRSVLNECYIMQMETASDIPIHARHLSLICTENMASIPETLYKAKNLRTLLLFGWSRITEVPSNLFESLKCLRALDLSGTQVKRLPNSLGDMKLLRYLNLSTTGIEKLPASITQLFLLQTLKLNECRMLCTLPKEMRKLVNLRHLEIKGTSALNYLPKGLGTLSSLHTLSKFIIGDVKGCKIEELKDLNRLQGELEIVNLEKLARANDGRMASMEKKQYIDVLSLCCIDKTENEWSMIAEDERERMHDVFGSLCPHENLRELRISNYAGFRLPTWVGNSSFHGLVSVRLVNCHLCRQLPSFGYLPSLKYLEIDGMRDLQYLGHIHFGVPFVGHNGFPALVDLSFKRMYNWETWELTIIEEQMPCLLRLTISECPKLAALPNELGNLQALESLVIERCPKLQALPGNLRDLTTLRLVSINECPLLKQRCQKDIGEDWSKLIHVSNVWIDGQKITNEKFVKKVPGSSAGSSQSLHGGIGRFDRLENTLPITLLSGR